MYPTNKYGDPVWISEWYNGDNVKEDDGMDEHQNYDSTEETVRMEQIQAATESYKDKESNMEFKDSEVGFG